MADRIMIIDGGEIKKIGTKDEVLPYLNRCTEMSQMCRETGGKIIIW